MRTRGWNRPSALWLLATAWLAVPPAAAVAQALESSNLPLIVIEVGRPIPDEPKVTGTMSVIDNGPGVRNRPSDPATDYSGPIAIEVRGSSSQSFPKKSYAVEMRDATGADVKAPLLGMPAEEDWVLYGPYSDKTFMRNALIMHLARLLGRYASRTRFVELVIDGAYQGVYVVMERIKRDENRVDIARLDPDEVTGEDVTGGYILKIDKTDGAQVDGWYSTFAPNAITSRRVYFQYHYPRPNVITPEQEAYIQQAVYHFESRMSSAAYADPVVGYTHYLDVDSAVDFILLVELGKNIDGYRLSTYLHRDRERSGEPPPRFVLGPVWDFNLAFGNANYYRGDRTDGFFIEDYDPNDYFPVAFWFGKLWNEPGFQSRVRDRWTNLRAGPLHRDSLHAYIDETADRLREAEARDAARWGNLGVYVWPNPVWPSTWAGELNYLKNWIGSRLVWMDQRLGSAVDVEPPGVPHPVQDLRLDLHPNPSGYQVSLEIRSTRGGPVRLHVFDVLGRIVHATTLYALPGNRATSIDIRTDGWAPGSYGVRAASDRGVVSAMLAVVR